MSTEQKDSRKKTGYFIVDSKNWKLTGPTSNGSIGSVTAMIIIKMENYKDLQESMFGKKIIEINDLLKPYLEKIDDIYKKYVNPNMAGDRICDVVKTIFEQSTHFTRNKKNSMFINKYKKSHFKTSIPYLLKFLFKAIEYYTTYITKNGWNGMFWDSLRSLTENLTELNEQVNKYESETVTILVKNKNSQTNEEADDQYEETNEVNTDKVKTEERQLKYNVIIRQVENITRSAKLAGQEEDAEKGFQRKKYNRNTTEYKESSPNEEGWQDAKIKRKKY